MKYILIKCSKYNSLVLDQFNYYDIIVKKKLLILIIFYGLWHLITEKFNKQNKVSEYLR